MLRKLGHYPVYSAGPNGDSTELQSYLQPLIQQYGVAAYFSGHDHISQHLQTNGIDYFISGAGCMADSMGSGSNADTVVWSGVGYSAFATVTLDSDYMTIDYTHWNGEVVYSFVKERPSRPPSTSPTAHPSGVPSATPTSVPTAVPSSAPSLQPTLSPTTNTELYLFHISNVGRKLGNEWLLATCGVSATLLVALSLCVASCFSRTKRSPFEKLNDNSEQSHDVEANLDSSSCSVDESKQWRVAIPRQVLAAAATATATAGSKLRERKKQSGGSVGEEREDGGVQRETDTTLDQVRIGSSSNLSCTDGSELDSSGKHLLSSWGSSCSSAKSTL